MSHLSSSAKSNRHPFTRSVRVLRVASRPRIFNHHIDWLFSFNQFPVFPTPTQLAGVIPAVVTIDVQLGLIRDGIECMCDDGDESAQVCTGWPKVLSTGLAFFEHCHHR